MPAGSIPGYLTFNTSDTGITTGNPFADLLMGQIASFGQQDNFVKYEKHVDADVRAAAPEVRLAAE